MKHLYKKKVEAMDANHPIYDIMERLTRKGLFPEIETQVNQDLILKRKRDMKYSTKEKLFKIAENWKNQPYKITRCTECGLDIPGPQEVYVMHVKTHFRPNKTEVEVHPYKT